MQVIQGLKDVLTGNILIKSGLINAIGIEILTRTEPFTLGEVKVTPNLNTIESEQGTQTLPPKVMSLLLLLLEHAGQPVSQQTIFDAVWPNQVVSDSSIYQAIARLRKALGDDKSKGIIERISGQGYRITLQPKLLTESESTSSSNLSLLAAMGTVVLIAIVLFFVFSAEQTDEPKSLSSLTIQPFDYEADEQEQLAIAIVDTLITQLVSIQDLTVVRHLDSEGEISSDAALSGRIYRSNDTLTVSINLMDRDSGEVIWAKLFNPKPDSPQERQIANALLAFLDQRQITDKEQDITQHPAYDEYLLARFLWNKRTEQSLLQAKDIYEQIRAQEQLFPLAAIGLCETYYFLYVLSDWTLDQAVNQCGPLIERALLEAPDLGQALAARANLLSRQQRYDEARQDFQRAVELAPNYALGHYWYGFLLREQGDYLSSLERFEKAYQLDPMSAAINLGLAYAHLNTGQVARARHFYQRAQTLDPNPRFVPVMDLDFYPLTLERADRFLAWVKGHQKALEIQPNYLLTNVVVLLSLHRVEDARALFDELGDRQVNPAYRLFVEAVLHTQENNPQAALGSLKARYEDFGKPSAYAMAYASHLATFGDKDSARDLLNTHFQQELENTTSVNGDNHARLVFWLALQEGDFSLQQQQLATELDVYFSGQNSLLAAEWWALRQEFDKVKAYLNRPGKDTEVVNFFEGHLLHWREVALARQLEGR